MHTSKGRSDVVVQFNNYIIVLEFKYASKSLEVKKKRLEGEQQMKDRGYARSYDLEGHKVLTVVIVADDENRRIL